MDELCFLSSTDIVKFPCPSISLSNPDGLLAIGGNLSEKSLLNAYKKGIFPWFNEDEPIMWWCPSLRAIIKTDEIHISKNMKKWLKKPSYQLKADENFEAVIDYCADRELTWITKEMREAYCSLHKKGVAHSIEVYQKNQLVGGLYGIFLNNLFCGESMFSLSPNASKYALIMLSQFLHANDCGYIDCQLPTKHLSAMGAKSWEREVFLDLLTKQTENNRLHHQSWSNLWQVFLA